MSRPIFCGNFDFEASSSDLERLFRRYGKVERVDLKSGFAFIYMEDERDAEYAIRALDRTEYGRKGRRLRVEWTKNDRGGTRKPVSSKSSGNLKPSKTLFVINFPYTAQERDLERHFDPYGKILNVRIRRNFAFIQYDSQEDATKALEATNMGKFLDRVISVEYSTHGDNGVRRNGNSPDRRGRDRSTDRMRRSPSPYKRQRGSPDYGADSSPSGYRRDRGSPVYGNDASRSPRWVDRGSPVYSRPRSRSPRRVDRGSPAAYRRDRGGPVYGNGGSRSPRRVDRGSPVYSRPRSRTPGRDERTFPEYRDCGQNLSRSRSQSPRVGRGRSPLAGERERNPLAGEREKSPLAGERERSPRGGERNGNGYGRRQSLSPEEIEEGAILDDEQDSRCPVKGSVSMDIPQGEDVSPADHRYTSRSPVARERSQS